MHTAACCPVAIPAPAIPTQRGWLQRGWAGLQAAWRRGIQDHRDRARLRAEWRSLQGLSDATLRDIGLAERQPWPSHSLGLRDVERNRWF